MSPVKIEKIDGYKVSTPGGVKAKKTTKEKAEAQANLLRAVDHGWKPTGKPARSKRKKVKVKKTPTGELKKIKIEKRK